MHFSAILLGCAGLLPATLAAITPPTNFVLQARSIKGVSSNSLYNKQFAVPSAPTTTEAVVIFTKTNGDAPFFQLGNPNVTGNGTFYTLNTIENFLGATTAQMNYDSSPFASWEPVFFVPYNSTTFKPSEMETGFYIGGTEDDMQLMWTTNYSNPSEGDFTGWLICYWSYLLPQLFFLPIHQNPKTVKLPASCEVVALQIIPAQS